MAHVGRTKKSLLDDEESEEELESEELKVNEAYAKRFEHNKRREELHRLQEKYGKGNEGDLGLDETDSEDEEEENEDGFAPQKTEEQFLKTLVRIKKRDPTIYDTQQKLYSDVDTDEEEEEYRRVKGEKKEKPMYIKDVMTKQILEQAQGKGEDLDQLYVPPVKTYQQEQDEARAAFLNAAQEVDSEEEGDGFGGGLLKKRVKTAEELKKDAQEDAIYAAEQAEKEKLARQQNILDEYFGKEEELNEDEKFLKSYILNRGWIDKEEDYRKEMEGLSEDEENVDKAEEFEYNFQHRFEEEGADRIISHPRIIEDSVRKDESSRKRKRKEREERKKAEMQAQYEEIKRLKNLKKMEMEEKLQKIREIAGYKGKTLEKMKHRVLEEDFDPERHDHNMQEIFDDEYYEDEGDEEALVKPEFGDMDEELERMAGIGEHPNKAAKKKGKGGSGYGKSREDLGMDEDDIEQSKVEAQKALDDYYKLDAEDHINGMPTRFKYKTVEPSYYGLDVLDILSREDRELNQVVSIKKLAPYREDKESSRKYKKVLWNMEKEEERKHREGNSKSAGKSSKRDNGKQGTKGEGERMASYGVPTVSKTK